MSSTARTAVTISLSRVVPHVEASSRKDGSSVLPAAAELDKNYELFAVGFERSARANSVQLPAYDVGVLCWQLIGRKLSLIAQS